MECAEEYILPRYRALEDHEVRTKTGPHDLVTQADIDVEAHLERVLPDLLPGSIVIGEEAVSEGRASTESLNNSGAIWVVDPVDGTSNFVHHAREFAVMLACVIDGKTQYGWIYDVLGEEMVSAEGGAGAFSSKNGRLNTAEIHGEGGLRGYLAPRYLSKSARAQVEAASIDFDSCSSLNCAGHEYLNIANSIAHFSVYSRLKPWDHLPGTLIVGEAGGYVAKWDGSSYTPTDTQGGLISACNKDVWLIVQEKLIRPLL